HVLLFLEQAARALPAGLAEFARALLHLARGFARRLAALAARRALIIGHRSSPPGVPVDGGQGSQSPCPGTARTNGQRRGDATGAGRGQRAASSPSSRATSSP